MPQPIHDAVVVGTGPSACGLIAALLERGIRPVVVDSSQVTPLSPAAASASVSDYVGFKTWKGSDAMYWPHPASDINYDPRLRIRVGNYLGGLSRVWGATYDRYGEYRRWPASCIPHAADWDVVTRLMPVAITGLGSPGHEGHHVPLPMASRLSHLWDRFPDSTRFRLQASRLALETRTDQPNHCTLAGQCLVGCPHDSIWWGGATFTRWSSRNEIQLYRGQWAHAFEEDEGVVRLRLKGTSAEETELRARHLFIAAGPISTAALILRSSRTSEVIIRDSMTAFNGLLDLRGTRERLEGYHTLSHLWARSAHDSSFTIQIYPRDASHAERLRKSVPRLPKAVAKGVATRFYPTISYLDSDASGSLKVTRAGTQIQVAPEATGDRRRMTRELASFGRLAMRHGFLLPALASEIGSPGSGFHIGASFPHGEATDDLGRPQGLHLVHLVDASVLPHLEAGSITPTVMANAARIGRTVPLA